MVVTGSELPVQHCTTDVTMLQQVLAFVELVARNRWMLPIRTAFRPAMAEGEPVDRPDVQLRHAFRYPRPAPGHPDVPLQSPGPGSGAPGGPLAYPGSDGDRHDGT